MYTQINEKIYNLKERLRTKEKLESLRDLAEKESRDKRNKLDELQKILSKEEKDVQKLEKMSLSSFFFEFVGKKEERLDKERKEFLAAKMQYDECIMAIEEIESEVEKCSAELSKYVGVKEEYEKAIRKKQEMIIGEDTDKGRRLGQLLERKDELNLDIKEVKEAINAGKSAAHALMEMKNPLDSAKNWGVWDMLGGGFFSDIMKHSKVNDANQLSYNVQHHLKVFQKELSDVNRFTEIQVNIGSFAKFADFFFDGLFSDWFVQSKINESISNVENAYSKVESILSDLDRNLSNMESEKMTLKEEIKKLLEE